MMKECNKCKCELALNNFHKNKGTKDGLQLTCKACRAKIALDYYRTEESSKRSKGKNAKR